MPRQALLAGAAEPRQARDHVIAGAQGRHLVADGLHHPGALVAEDEGLVERISPEAIDDVQVAVTDAGRHRAHEHLASPRLVDVDVLDRERRVHLPEDGGFHAVSFYPAGWPAFTASTWPEMLRAASLQKNRVASTMSSAVTKRLSGD